MKRFHPIYRRCTYEVHMHRVLTSWACGVALSGVLLLWSSLHDGGQLPAALNAQRLLLHCKPLDASQRVPIL